MPITVPTIVRSDSDDIERLNKQYLGQYQYTPDLQAAVAARIKQGIENSTGKVIYDLIARPSAGDDPKINIRELYNDYPTANWEEPMTRNQAEYRMERQQVRQQTQDIIDKREQGAIATGLGLTASFGTSMLLSPESYFAPVVGGLTSSAAARVASATMSTRKGFKMGSILKSAKRAAKRVKNSQVLTSPKPGSSTVTQAVGDGLDVVSPFKHSKMAIGLAKIEQLQNKHRFMAGFAEDTMLTAAFTEPLFMDREEMLGNPQGTADYMTNVLLAGTLSGLLNTGAGRLIDRVQMGQELEYRAQELTQLLTGQEEPITSPVARKIARAEWKMSRQVGSWKANNLEFDGEIRIGHNADSKFSFGYISKQNAIVINTAKLDKGVDVKRAMDQSMLDFHRRGPDAPDPEAPDFKVKIGPSGVEAVDGADLPDLTQVMLTDAPTSPHMAYNLAKPKENLVQHVTKQMDDEMGAQRNMAPHEVAEAEVGEFDKSLEVESNSDGTVTPVEGAANSETANDLTAQMKEKRRLANGNAAHALNMAAAVRDTYDSFGQGIKQKGKVEFSDATPADRFAAQLLDDAGYKPQDLATANPDVVKADIDAQVNIWMQNEALRVLRQLESNKRWKGFSESGRADIHGNLDGSLVAGGDFFTKQGDNTYRRMEVYRSRYSNLLHTNLINSGVQRHLSKYGPEAEIFWGDVDKAMRGVEANVSPEAKSFASTLSEVAEHQRTMLNRQGAGIRKLKGFFMTTVHNTANIKARPNEWRAFMLNSDNVDWGRMGYAGDSTDLVARNDFLDAAFENIESGGDLSNKFDATKAGGKKGEKFAHQREIHFQPGKQTSYNDVYGNQNTAREIMDQVELRGKAMAITETMGPDTKKTWAAMQPALEKMSKRDQRRIKRHWDEITGETNTVVNQPIASIGQGFRNLVNAMVLHGTGITVALTDPVSQIVNLRTSGMATSLGRAARMVFDSYGESIQAIIKNNDTAATRRIKASILPHDTNLQGARIVLGDSSISREGGLLERLSLSTIKWSGAGVFTKISQMSTVIGMQRQMANLVGADFNDDLRRQLSRFDVSEADFRSLGKYKLDDQISVFDIEDQALRVKMQNMLDEGMRMGSLQADPRQASQVKFGKKSGTILGEAARSWTQYLPTALAQHQKLLMRMAVMGGGDARFVDLMDRSRIAEVATVLGMMLGSATMVVTLKDAMKNKEPFWLGEKPFNDEMMMRILQVSGVLPLVTEFEGLARGGMAGQMAADAYKIVEKAGQGDVWQTAHLAKQSSPFVGMNIGPVPSMLETMIGLVSEEYLLDQNNRQAAIEARSGQGKLITFGK